MSRNGAEDKVRLLRALAFHIHKKLAAADALAECFEAEGRGGRHRQWRQAGEVLKADGFVPALAAAELIGEEAAAILATVAAAGDHRLLSAALGALADHHEGREG
jgi:hypothetical protein